MQKCGECYLCCVLPEIVEADSADNEICRHCAPARKGKSCKIYARRPQVCKDFWCMWAQMPYVGPDIRPDKIGMFFIKLSENTIVARQDPAEKLTPFGAAQIDAFNKQGYSVFLVQGNQRKLYLSLRHEASMIMGEINDSAKLHRGSN